jgi:hypothetical protein
LKAIIDSPFQKNTDDGTDPDIAQAVRRPKDSQDIPSLQLFQVKNRLGVAQPDPIQGQYKALERRDNLQALG